MCGRFRVIFMALWSGVLPNAVSHWLLVGGLEEHEILHRRKTKGKGP